MAENVGHVAPFINDQFIVTAIFGDIRPYETHKGIDIATSGSKPLYAVDNGEVILKGGNASTGYGYYFAYKNQSTGVAYFYGHMASPSPLSVGDTVTFGTYVGDEGTTGSSTGIHLHFEMQNLGSSNTWNFSTPFENMMNPADYMGIRNAEDGTWWIYNGTPIPPTPPTPTDDNNSKKWFKFKKRKSNIIL